MLITTAAAAIIHTMYTGIIVTSHPLQNQIRTQATSTNNSSAKDAKQKLNFLHLMSLIIVSNIKFLANLYKLYL